MLFGLGLGLVVALAVYLNGERRDPVPPAASVSSPAPVAAGAVQSRAPGAATVESTAAQPAPDTPENADEQFDFYDLLPRFEVVIPEVEGDVRADRSREAVDRPGRYIVQAGSFRDFADADRRQAQIALLGIESRVQRVTIDDEVYHRVRIGPVGELAELNRIRRLLRNERIETLLIRFPE